MKRESKSSTAKMTFFETLSELSGCEILNPHEMICVRGGDGEGSGGEPIIIIPGR
jgi:hypothetical protein